MLERILSSRDDVEICWLVGWTALARPEALRMRRPLSLSSLRREMFCGVVVVMSSLCSCLLFVQLGVSSGFLNISGAFWEVLLEYSVLFFSLLGCFGGLASLLLFVGGAAALSGSG